MAVGLLPRMTVREMQRGFFHRKKVIEAVGKYHAKRLALAGAYVRTAAKSSIRRSKKPSQPGKPPKSQTGLIKDYLFFAYDSDNDSVVVGPALLSKRSTVPQTLEFGGKVTITDSFLSYTYDNEKRIQINKWVPQSKRLRQYNLPTRKRTVTIQPRPFMGPALSQSMPAIQRAWAQM